VVLPGASLAIPTAQKSPPQKSVACQLGRVVVVGAHGLAQSKRWMTRAAGLWGLVAKDGSVSAPRAALAATRVI